jgi:MinD-like ATPase involved in chromosome partitioning or flagellar assembly
VSRVVLWVDGGVEERLALEVAGSGDVLAGTITTMTELRTLVTTDAIDVAVIMARPAELTEALIAACDLAGVRLVAIAQTDADRRHALAMDFSETCPADAPWDSMLALLRPESFAPGGIPELAFFDITTDAPPQPILTRVQEEPTIFSNDVAPTGEVSDSGEAPIVAVWGPTGAPGRTSVALNLAAELAIQGRSVLLIDADSYGGAIAPRLGLLDETPGFAAVCRLADHEVLTRQEFERVAQQAEVGDHKLWVLTGILRADRWPELSGERVDRVLEICRKFVDVIVMDVGFSIETDEEIMSDLVVPRRNGATLAALGAADTIVAVADSDVVGLARFLRSCAEVRELFETTPVIAVANRVRSAVAGITPRAQVRQTLERFGGHTDVALIPFDDRAFDACSLRAAPLCTAAPKSGARAALRELAQRCFC